MHDAKVLAACMSSREAFDKVRGHVDASDMTPMAAFWWPLIAEWYGTDPVAMGVDISLLKAKGLRKVDDKLEETMTTWFDALPEVPSAANVVADLLEVKRYAKGNELGAAIASGDDRKAIKRLLAEYDELLVATSFDNSKVQYASSGEELFTTLSQAKKWRLSPKLLDERTEGGLSPGDFMILFGRKEMGKTLFCVNLVCGFLRQGARVQYVGNEDSIDKIKFRIMSNLANMTKAELFKWQDVALERARKHGFDDRLFMTHLHPGTVAEIEELVVNHEPDILIIDQVRNIGGGGDGLTARLNQVAIDVRQLISKHQIVGVGVTQAHAGEHGRPKLWLDNDDMDSSRTGLPAQGDLICGISADESMKNHNTRTLSLPTNKIGGHHEGFTYKIDTQRNKVL